MSFLMYDLGFLVIFSLAIALFLYKKRKSLTRDGWMYLYKTAVGLKVIDSIGKKYKKTLKFLSYAVVLSSYCLMALMIYFLYQLISIFMKPEYVQLIKIPPLMPIIPYLPNLFSISWLPPFYFTYWILAIAIVAIVHEGAHGIYAKLNGVRIKSTGFGFLGPFLAFFVEQDDKQMQKKKIFPQLTILGAGVFANLVFTLIFFLIMMGFFSLAYSPSGALFNDYAYGAVPVGIMSQANFTGKVISIGDVNLSQVRIENQTYFITQSYFDLNKSQIPNSTMIKLYLDYPAINLGMKGAVIEVNNVTVRTNQEERAEIDKYKPGDSIIIKTRYSLSEYSDPSQDEILTYNITLAADYSNSSRPVIGTVVIITQTNGIRGFLARASNSFKDPSIDYNPKANPELTIFIYNLLWWIVLINISLALSNMLPMGIFDGGRFFYLTVLGITKNKKIAEASFKWATRILLLVFVLLMVLWVRGMYLS